MQGERGRMGQMEIDGNACLLEGAVGIVLIETQGCMLEVTYESGVS